MIRQPAKHEGPGEHFLAYDEAAGGYVCWLKGEDARPHVVTLQISVGLNTVGEERTLSLMVAAGDGIVAAADVCRRGTSKRRW